MLKTYPVCSAEVYSFSKVISLIEATVVGSGEGDDKFTSTLVGAYNLPMRNTEVNYRFEHLKLPVHICIYVYDSPVHHET